jgi:hypothetical protein
MRRHERAQALVEFALIAPIFFILLFAIIEGGRFILYYETLNNATREGARYAIVHGYNTPCSAGGPSGQMPPGETPPGCHDLAGANVVQRVKDTAFGVLGSAVGVTPCWIDPVTGTCTGNNGRDQDVKVTATYTYSSLIPIVPLPAISITAESTLVINN